ncbi:MAG: hypothetical protein HYY18_08345 [Planctomycetes bacterium]|nr:hypothetical protein [Planctomycetota bacterium]
MNADRRFHPAEVFRRVIEILESLGVRYAVGGSIASSVRGIERSTQDMDVLVELPEDTVGPLVAAFSKEFYIAEPAVRRAVAGHLAFNVVHLQQGLKADLFVAGGNPLDEAQLSHATREVIDPETGATAFVTSSEVIVLVKLDWYRRGGGVGDRQWEDVKNVLKTDPGVRLEYLREKAGPVGLVELLGRALKESGLA